MENYKLIHTSKKILFLGNGFDLAHGLPTRYSDFLEFCEKASRIYTYAWGTHINQYKEDNIEKWKIRYHIKYILYTAYKNRQKGEEITTPNKELNKFYSCIKDNIWYYYFSNNRLHSFLGRNWIDFESEIKLCIKYIDENSKHLSKKIEDLFMESAIGDDIGAGIRYSAFKFAVSHSPNKIKDVLELRTVLYDDLKNLTQALEIYLMFVESDNIEQISKDILKLKPNCIINFNYTNTYQKIYSNCKNVFHIHGELNHEPNNMVLGIDEYWSEEERDNHTNFTIFKKFAQRIQKSAGVASYRWIKEIEETYQINHYVSEVYIFGHSLDITDKDILYDYLASEATSVTIYCRDEETEGEYIANVIKLIGEKRLLEKVNQYPPKLKFVIQQDMIPIEEKEKELSTSGAAP